MSNIADFFKNIFQDKKPIVKENTFFVWEPCSKSHAEVIPGYAKYLLDLGYHVSVLVEPDRLKEGLFCRFGEENISYNIMTKKQIEKYFKNNTLNNVAGVLVTTVGKICDSINFEQAYNFFAKADKNKLFFVEHEAKPATDNGSWNENLITLRKLNYKNSQSVVVNPHYFGKFERKQKNDVTNFVVVGKFSASKKDTTLIVKSAQELVKNGYTNFKITVIGKGDLDCVPNEIKKFIDIKGRLSFADMYDEMEKADFMLTAYDDSKEEHLGYITSSTSGCFQLVYGFLKPCVIIRSFAEIHGFDDGNSVIYENNDGFYNALETCINMSKNDYAQKQQYLSQFVDYYYNYSKENFKNLIIKQKGSL